jgi:sugar phosphate isomerase/epimerase
MRLGDSTHLTYCTNIHPGERWEEVRANLERHVLEVKRRVSPDAPFGVGLRLSARAADALAEGGALAELRRFLQAHDLYVFTINGFPYGPFHGQPVKERVYLPDWRDGERLRYSNRLAELLAALMPEGLPLGSVSTVPGAFAAEVRSDGDVRAMASMLVQHVAFLHALEQRTGRRVALALEPEPCCYLETVAQAVRFFEQALRGEAALSELAEATGRDLPGARALLDRHLGLCLDACHAAVEMEDAAQAVAALRAARVPVFKIQLSAGLRIAHVDAAARAALTPYLDGVYLHQVVERWPDGAIRRHLDLPQALDALDADAEPPEWRVHFHVPVFLQQLGAFESTQPFLRELLALQRRDSVSTHLEVETYTWDVLPPEARTAALEDAIAREIDFCRGLLAE